jgi:hypothetical protein
MLLRTLACNAVMFIANQLINLFKVPSSASSSSILLIIIVITTIAITIIILNYGCYTKNLQY